MKRMKGAFPHLYNGICLIIHSIGIYLAPSAYSVRPSMSQSCCEDCGLKAHKGPGRLVLEHDAQWLLEPIKEKKKKEVDQSVWK